MSTSPHPWYARMRSNGPNAARPAAPDPARREAGFTLVEILVVLVIMAILMGLIITQFRSSKEATYYRSAQAVATTYADAIEAFMTDNGQRVPVVGDANQWPGGAAFIKGPVDRMMVGPGGGPKPYLRRGTPPEQVTNGLVGFAGPGTSISGSPRAKVTYQANGSNYTLLVETIPTGGAPVQRCAVTNATSPPPGVERCA